MTSAIEFRNVIFANGNRNAGLAVRLLGLMETHTHTHTLMHEQPCISRARAIIFKIIFKKDCRNTVTN